MYVYEQIANDIIESILDKQIKPGEKLPSEGELIKKYGSSKMTIRRAFQLLKDMDVVTSKQGSGIYVKDNKQKKLEYNQYLAGYTLLAILKGFDPYISEVTVKHRHASLNIANTLGIDYNEPILQIERSRSTESQKVAFEVAYIQKSKISSYDVNELYDSLHRFINNHCEQQLDHSSRFYSAVSPQQYLQSKLDLDEHEAVFVIEQISYSKDGKPMLYTKSFQAGNMINI